jgi:hypothetical protein
MVDKRDRRTKDEIADLRNELLRIVEENAPLTVRAVFYLAIAAMLIPKSEKQYKNTIVRLISLMREEWLAEIRDDIPPTGAVIPFGDEHIIDASRWIRKPSSYSGPEEALRETAALYRRDLWHDADAYVAFYCEKETIADLVYQRTEAWDVPLSVFHGLVARGFSGRTPRLLRQRTSLLICTSCATTTRVAIRFSNRPLPHSSVTRREARKFMSSSWRSRPNR